MTYRIRYEAENHYQHVVQEAIFEFLVMPCEDETQTVENIVVDNSLNRPSFRTRNAFGYDLLCLRVDEPFSNLTFMASCTVKKQEVLLRTVLDSLPLEEEQALLRSEEFLVDHYLHIMPTALTQLAGNHIADSLLYQHDQPLFSYVTSLNQAIYGMMEYKSGATTFRTTAEEVMASPQGVCQDYTHLMLGILRHQQLPCRYVSGYINQGQQLLGATQTHAWVEVFIPNMGWVGFDPTNNLLADHHHIKIADGLDYQDCGPLKGHIRPGMLNRTDHIVHVVEQ